MNPNLICKICGNAEGNQAFTAREMMYGSKDKFEYFECRSCGCLQVLLIREDLSKYYPEDFYAFQQVPKETYQSSSWLRSYLRRVRAKYLISGKGVIGKAILRSTGDYFGKTYDWDWFKKTSTGLESSILDVGCGAGKMLRAMEEHGFSCLTGIDPYIEQDVTYGPIKLYKKTLEQLDGTFELIMLHHSFEHMPDPLATLKQLNRLLKPMHCALIRIPVAGSFAWKKYGVNWAQLDAPRHIFLHTKKSISILARDAGFELMDVVYDSTAFQFMGSEQYLADIPLRSQKSYVNGLEESIFTTDDIRKFRQMADELNKSGEGDQACFYLKKTSSLIQ